MYEQLFANMQHHVEQEVLHYKKDLIYDKKEIERFGKSGAVYYWLVRENGTNLYNLRNLIVDLQDWNTLWRLIYYKDYANKHLYRIQITEMNETLEGLLMPMDFDKVCADLQTRQKLPYAIVIAYQDKEWQFPLKKDSSAMEILCRFCLFANNKELHWSDLDYNFLYQ